MQDWKSATPEKVTDFSGGDLYIEDPKISSDGRKLFYTRGRTTGDIIILRLSNAAERKANSMTLAAGTRLGPYEIQAPIGAGGMGEVYRARDTRLDRTVAIKVLSPKLAPSPEARQRFEREARTISKLSHPSVCALYDLGREGEIEYLVMELLEGETLAQALARGPLPLDQALRIGVLIAGALDAAHRRGSCIET